MMSFIAKNWPNQQLSLSLLFLSEFLSPLSNSLIEKKNVA